MIAAWSSLLREGGPVLAANLGLAVLLYGRCCGLLARLWRTRRALARCAAGRVPPTAVLRSWQEELRAHHRREGVLIGAMIAAAPLLGLLGTVAGMITTFEHLSSSRSSAIEGLAGGISEALLNTEAGLAVAIPAVLLFYYAHRQVQKGLRDLVRLEDLNREGC